MRVLVACEFSGRVRDAFAARGHDAWSADLRPSLTAGQHYQGDVTDVLHEEWDLLIAHPPCTYLANSGVHWLHKQPERWDLMREGAEFFRLLYDAPVRRIAVENPIPHKYARELIGRPSQWVQPYEYGSLERKKTGLWLRNLPPLLADSDGAAATAARPYKERQRVTWSGSRSEQAGLRSITPLGIAAAMADQWGELDAALALAR